MTFHKINFNKPKEKRVDLDGENAARASGLLLGYNNGLGIEPPNQNQIADDIVRESLDPNGIPTVQPGDIAGKVAFSQGDYSEAPPTTGDLNTNSSETTDSIGTDQLAKKLDNYRIAGNGNLNNIPQIYNNSLA